MLAVFPCIQCYGRQKNVILILTRQHQMDTLHILRQRHVHADALSGEIYSAYANLRKGMKHRDERNMIVYLGGKPGFDWHP